MDEIFNIFKKYSKKYNATLNQKEKHLLNEFKDKLIHINDLNTQIVKLNKECLEYSYSRFDPKTDAYSVGGLSIKLRRADPTKEITMSNIAAGYTKGDQDDQDDPFFPQELKQKQRELERLTVNFYEYAHRIIKICKYLPGLKSFKCHEITLVRNKLISHPETEKDSGVVLDSFAYSNMNGPIIKGTRYSNQASIFPTKGYNNDYVIFINQVAKYLGLAIGTS